MTGNPVVLVEEKVLKVDQGNVQGGEELVKHLDGGEAGLGLRPLVPGHKVSRLVRGRPPHLHVEVAWKEVWKLGVGDELTALSSAASSEFHTKFLSIISHFRFCKIEED